MIINCGREEYCRRVKQTYTQVSISVLSRCRWNKWIRLVTAVNSQYRWHNPSALARTHIDLPRPGSLLLTLCIFVYLSTASSSANLHVQSRLFHSLNIGLMYVNAVAVLWCCNCQVKKKKKWQTISSENKKFLNWNRSGRIISRIIWGCCI